MIEIAPSILNADLCRLGEEAAKVSAADRLHLDVMDGYFVPNLTFGPLIAEALAQCQSLPVEAHLMVEDPERMLPWFIKAGCRSVIIHLEATPHIHRVVAAIKAAGAEAGAALNPGTPVDLLAPVMPDLDLVLIMTVDPGMGGQRLLPAALAKITAAKAMTDRLNQRCRVAVDGGINADNFSSVEAAGADVAIIGSAIFRAADPAAEVARFRGLIGRRE